MCNALVVGLRDSSPEQLVVINVVTTRLLHGHAYGHRLGTLVAPKPIGTNGINTVTFTPIESFR